MTSKTSGTGIFTRDTIRHGTSKPAAGSAASRGRTGPVEAKSSVNSYAECQAARTLA